MVGLLSQLRDVHWPKFFGDVLRIFLILFPRPKLVNPALNRSATVISDLAGVSVLFWLCVLLSQLGSIGWMGLCKFTLYILLLYVVHVKAVSGRLKTALLVYWFSVSYFYTITVLETLNFQSLQFLGSLITIVVSTLTLGYGFGFLILVLWVALLTAFMQLSHPAIEFLIPLSRYTRPENVPGYLQDYGNALITLLDIYIASSLVRAHIFSQLKTALSDQEKIAVNEHAARKNADKANSEKNRFMAAASHDLRQPVSSLNLDFKTYVQAHPEAQDDSTVQSMANSIETLNKLLDSVLTISKLQANVVAPTISSVSIASILQQCYASNATQAREKNLKLRLRLRTADIFCDTDPDMLYRIVNNIVDNAVKYTERGGVIIGVRRRHGAPCIFVMDSGIGIPAESKEAIFEEFTMLVDPSRKSAGSGLGLAIVKRTADLLGMKIHTESKVGVGSTFYLQLPKLRAKPVKQAISAPKPVAMDPQWKLDGMLVAVVDDVVSLRLSICRMLQAHGMRTIDGGSWAELESALDGARPDVLITDYQLDQDKSGYDVVLAARKHISETLPCFIITGDTSQDLVRELAGLNVETLYKPLSTEAMLEAIQRHVSAAKVS